MKLTADVLRDIVRRLEELSEDGCSPEEIDRQMAIEYPEFYRANSKGGDA